MSRRVIRAWRSPRGVAWAFVTACALALSWAAGGEPAPAGDDGPAPATAPTTRRIRARARRAEAAPAPTTAASTRPATRPAVADERVDALVEQLSAGDWRRRDAVQADLLALGPDARPRLAARLAGELPPEVRARIESVVKELNDRYQIGPSLVTLHVKGAEAGAVFEELFRQAGAEFVTTGPETFASAKRVDADFVRVPFWAAMRDVCAQTGLNARHVYNARHLTIANDNSGAPMKGPAVVDGPVLVAASGINGSLRVDWSNPASAVRNGSIDMMVLLEPRFRATSGSVEVTKLADEQGRSLLVTGDAAQRVTGEPGILRFETDYSWAANVPIDLARNAARIAAFEGRVHVMASLGTTKAEVADVLKAKEVTREVGGKRFTVHDVTADGNNGYEVKMTLYRGKMSAADWQWFHYPYGRLRLEDADGHPLNASGGGGSSDNKEATFNMRFSRDSNGAAVAPGEPARFVWELPTETRELIVPFRFTDLPLP